MEAALERIQADQDHVRIEAAEAMAQLHDHDDDGEEKKQDEKWVAWSRTNEAQCQALTGFSRADFGNIQRVLSSALIPRSFGRAGRRPEKLGRLEDRLLLFLTWLHTGYSYKTLGAFFGLSAPYCMEVLAYILDLAHPLLKRRWIVPLAHATQADQKSLLNDFPECSLLIDVTCHRIQRPSGQHQLYYSGHKKQYCMKSICLHHCDGSIAWAKCAPGHSSDEALATEPDTLDMVSINVLMC